MHFRLDPESPPPTEFRRVVLEQLELAIRELHSENIHQTRIAIKQMRALLDLAGSAGRDATAKAQAKVLRNAARNISEARDIDVCLTTLDQLKETGECPISLFRRARSRASAPLNPAETDPEAAIQHLDAVRHGLLHWIPNIDTKSIQDGLDHSYRRSRNACWKAKRAKLLHDGAPKHLRSPEAMHRLRRQLKRLWAQLRLVRDFRPRKIKVLTCKLKKITDLLGLEHDLIVLQLRLNYPQADPKLAPLIRTIEKRRAELDHKTLLLAARFLKNL